MDQSRPTEARNLEGFWMKTGFEAPTTRFRPSTLNEEPSDRQTKHEDVFNKKACVSAGF
jgi:hypothetical protein